MTTDVFFEPHPQSLSALAAAIGARLEPESAGETVINSASPIEDAAPGSISFVDNPRYVRFLESTRAAAVICNEKIAGRAPAGSVLLIHDEPYRAYAKALSILFPSAARPEPVTGETGISPAAHIGDNVEIEDGVIIEAGAVIGAGASIGRGSLVMPNAVIGRNVKIGRNSTVGPNASVFYALVGDHVIIHAGVRIGEDGFGFAMGAKGHAKVAQIGRVIIQDHVEIGANTTIDRGANRDTIIGEGTKIDNLVQIGHNVNIGRHCVIVGLAGIAGSATLEDFVVVAGHSGVNGHITLGMGAQVGGGTGVFDSLEPGTKVMGYPAIPVRDWVRQNMLLKAMLNKGADKSGPKGGE